MLECVCVYLSIFARIPSDIGTLVAFVIHICKVVDGVPWSWVNKHAMRVRTGNPNNRNNDCNPRTHSGPTNRRKDCYVSTRNDSRFLEATVGLQWKNPVQWPTNQNGLNGGYTLEELCFTNREMAVTKRIKFGPINDKFISGPSLAR